jgi:outer membrane receptor protein involved in Fe transport
MYELGIKHKFNENLVMEFKAYYKDQFDYPTSQRISMENPRYGNLSFQMYINMDYARSKGIEIRVKQRAAKYLSGMFNFSYAVSKGKSSTPNDNLLVEAGRLEEKPLKESYLRWDKPIRVTLDLNFDVDKNQGPRVFGLQLPDLWGLSAHWELESGKRYTPLLDIEKEIYDSGDPNSKMAPYWNQLDFRLYKNFQFSGYGFSAILEVENALDAKIPRIINPYTGREYRPGDILTQGYTRDFNPDPNPIFNPAKYRWPRTVRLGFSLRF